VVSDAIQIALIAPAGSIFGAGFGPAITASSKIICGNRNVDMKLKEHRDELTFDVIKTARDEIKRLNEEATQLRPLVIRMVHLDEALDHLEALTTAHTDAEKLAAETRG